MQTRKSLAAMVAVGFGLATCWAVNAQEFAYEKMTGVNPLLSSYRSLYLPTVGITKQHSNANPHFAHVRNLERQHFVCAHAMDGTSLLQHLQWTKKVLPRDVKTSVRPATHKCSTAVQLKERILKKDGPIPLSAMLSVTERSWWQDVLAMERMRWA